MVRIFLDKCVQGKDSGPVAAYAAGRAKVLPEKWEPVFR